MWAETKGEKRKRLESERVGREVQETKMYRIGRERDREREKGRERKGEREKGRERNFRQA